MVWYCVANDMRRNEWELKGIKGIAFVFLLLINWCASVYHEFAMGKTQGGGGERGDIPPKKTKKEKEIRKRKRKKKKKENVLKKRQLKK